MRNPKEIWPSITEAQRQHLIERLEDPEWEVCYWTSNQFGLPTNSGIDVDPEIWRAEPGKLQRTGADEPRSCTPTAVHGSYDPLFWSGNRLWLVALKNPKTEYMKPFPPKLFAAEREIICEIFPEDAVTDSVRAFFAVNAVRRRAQTHDLEAAVLDSMYLRDQVMRDCVLAYSRMNKLYINGGGLTYSNAYSARFGRVRILNAIIHMVSFCRAEIEELQIVRSSVYSVGFEDVKNISVSFINTHIVDTSFEASKVSGGFVRCALDNVNFKDADISGLAVYNSEILLAIMPDGRHYHPVRNNFKKYGAEHV